jgi:hypothetical protein
VAQSERAWPVENKLVGKDDKKSENVGGIACVSNTAPARLCESRRRAAECAVAHREEREIVAEKAIRLLDDRHEGNALELDREGVTYGNGFFYVIGTST